MFHPSLPKRLKLPPDLSRVPEMVFPPPWTPGATRELVTMRGGGQFAGDSQPSEAEDPSTALRTRVDGRGRSDRRGQKLKFLLTVATPPGGGIVSPSYR